jgi:L-alanine-DL-glutamate epimerase-like enolase superfamily enzyme
MTQLVDTRADVAVDSLDVHAFEIPVDGPDGKESDGTLEWDSTTVVVVEAHAGGETGIGYSYASKASAVLIDEKLRSVVEGADALDVGARWQSMARELRNAGRPGAGMMAVSAVDTALWDLKARVLGVPLTVALDAYHAGVPIYGSGGFCNYSLERLGEQLGGWVEQGIPRVKLKTSRHPEEDPKRLDAVREAIGDGPALLTDANGALTRKDALYWAQRFRAEWGVVWFEEPVTSADFDGLRLLRDRGPAGLDVAAGEYAFVAADVRNLLVNGCVDCLQLDVTRCGGFTALRHLAGLADGHGIEVSAHCAPQLSAHGFCAVRRIRHLEYFHDHVRIERMLFDGVLEPTPDGTLRPDRSRPGLGLEPRFADVEQYRVYGKES